MKANESYLKELNMQGRTLFSCDKYDEAIKIYERALKEDPMYLQTYFNICEAFIMADKYESAKKMMKRVLLISKDNGEAYYHLGNIALLQEEYEEGRLQYAKAINNGYDISQIYLNLAAVAEDNDEWGDALANYTKAIVRDRRCYSAKIRKIQIYMMLKRNEDALNAADDLIETNPEIFEGHHFKFVVLATMGSLEEAGKVLDKAQSLFPDDQGFVLDRAKLYEMKNKFSDALEVLEKIDTEVVPKEAILIEKARILLAMGQTDSAQELLESYTGDQMLPEIDRILILIYMEKKEFNKMLICANRIIDLKTHDSHYFAALYFKAYALKMKGEIKAAEAAYTEAARIMQQACSINSAVLDLYIYRAICYRELQMYDKANEMLDYVAAVDENIPEIYYIRSLIYTDLKDERAESELNRAKILNPKIAGVFGE